MRRIQVVFLVILCLLVFLYFARNIFIKATFQKAVKMITGLDLNMQSINVEIFRPIIDVRGFELINPAGFSDKLMVNMPRIYLNYEPFSFLKGKIHLRNLTLNLEELMIVKNAQGTVNIESLQALKPKGKGKMPELKIDLLKLKIGRVIYKDYSGGFAPQITEFRVNIDEEYRNINNPQALVGLIAAKALMNTAIGSLANVDLGSFKAVVSESAKGAAKIAQDAAQVAKEAAKKVEETASEAVKDTVDKLKSIIPLGNK